MALLAGFGARVAAAALAADMVGAVSTPGRVEGGAFNLGLAPALLVLMLVVVWAGPGRLSVDRRLAVRLGA